MWSPFQQMRSRERRDTGADFDLRHLTEKRRRLNHEFIRRSCQSAYLGNDTAICRVLGRYKMYVDTNDVQVSPHLIMDGYWEMWLTEVLADAVKPGMIAVDIGANLGYFTLLMADLVGPEGHVHAFEPNTAIADRLTKSVACNGFTDRVSLHRDPLGDEDGRPIFLTVPASQPSAAHLTDDSEAVGAIALTMRRLDGFDGLLPDIIKIDAESAEQQILQGMSGLLAACAKPLTIFMEFALVRYLDPAAFLAEIVNHGFSLGEVDQFAGVQPRSMADLMAADPLAEKMLVLTRP